MIRFSTKQIPTIYKDDFALILKSIREVNKVLKYEDELYDVWQASPFIRQVCISQPIWLEKLIDKQELNCEFDVKIYKERLFQIFSQIRDIDDFKKLLRRIRAAEYARIAWRDLQEYASVKQTLTELSLFAQCCLEGVLDWCYEWLKAQPGTTDFERSLQKRIVIFSLGKLGGGELNFSSDVDLVFAYSQDTKHTQEEGAQAAIFYLKIVQNFIKVVSEQTEDGFVFRVDTRLRPFGNSGTLIPTLTAIEQYFQSHGRDWERYAWIKARVIVDNFDEGREFLKDVEPFLYRRYLDYGAVQSLRAMKELVDVKARQSASVINVKIGQGGIREIEFIAQMFQLIYGGKDHKLRICATLKVITYLGELELLTKTNVTDLVSAYNFLRKVENGLQLRNDQQVHTLPKNNKEQSNLAYLLGFHSWEDFVTKYELHTSNVNKVFRSLLQINDMDDSETAEAIKEFTYFWQQIDDKDYCLNILDKYTKDAPNIYDHLRVFSQTVVVQQLTSLARKRLDEFVPLFLSNALMLEDPSLIIDRFLIILKKIVQRSTYISLLIENQNKLNKLFKLIEASSWVAQYVSTHPILLDEILRMDSDYEPPSIMQMKNQLIMHLRSVNNDLEKYMEGLREFKNAQLLQIAAADIAENYPTMRVSDHLSWLAEICITSAIDRAFQDLIVKYGKPKCLLNSRIFEPELLVIEYGKLGGLELGYGSDLDIIFLHNSSGDACETIGQKKLGNEVFFTRLVQRAIHLLTTVTSAGKVFEVDTRLRPYGESGAIVSSVSAFERYLENEAWLWEKQALIRARPLSRDSNLTIEFKQIRKKILCQVRDITEVRNSIMEMREKILAERNGASDKKFNIKKDKGGLIDIEFIVQYYVLSYAHKYPSLVTYTDNVRILDACAESGLIDRSIVEDLKSTYLMYRKHLNQLNLRLLPHLVDESVFSKERSVIQNYWASLLH